MTSWHSRGRRRLGALSGALLVLAVFAAACGDDDVDTGANAGNGAVDDTADTAEGDAAEFDEMISIGINESTSGAAASNGGPFRDSALLAIEAVNNDGGVEIDGTRYGFEAVERDNETDPEKAIGVAQEFLRDGIRFVLGPGISTVFSPAHESIQGTDTLVISAAGVATSVVGTPEGELLFSPINPQAGETGLIKDAADTVIDNFAPKTAAILLPDDPLGELHGGSFQEAFEAAGVEIVYNDRFAADTVDFAPFVAQLKSSAPDVVVVGPLDRYVEPILAESKDAGFTSAAFVGSPGVSQAPFLDAPEFSRAMVTMVTRAVDNLEDESLDEFREVYTSHFESEPGPSSFWSLIYYDSVKMLAKAMEEAGTVEDVQAIADALKSDAVTDYPARALDLTFDENGQAHYPIQHRIIEDGESTYVGG